VNDSPLQCPGCNEIKPAEALERSDGRAETINLCFPCHVIWFDQGESGPLAPRAVMKLFQAIHAHHDTARHPLPERLRCPRCTELLELTHDLVKTGRFTYYRCLHGHGRLTSFFQFLREKQFVRDLTPAELTRVRAEIRELHCSSCGAPIDLQRDASCRYCGAAISVLDADAVGKAVRMWAEAQAKQTSPPQSPIQPRPFEGLVPAQDAALATSDLVELVSLGVSAIGSLLNR